MTLDELVDDIDQLVSSKSELLAEIDTSPSTQSELSNALDVTVATVSRNLSDLDEEELSERQDGQYYLTEFRERTLQCYRRYRNDLTRVCEVDAANAMLDAEFGYDAAIFDDADIVFSDRQAPDSGLNAIRDEVQSAVTVRSVFDNLLTNYFDVYDHRSTKPKDEITYVLPESLANMVQKRYGKIVTHISKTQPLTLLITPEPVDYSVTVTEQADGSKQSWIIAHGSSGVEAVVRNDSHYSVEWAESEIRSFIESATKLELS